MNEFEATPPPLKTIEKRYTKRQKLRDLPDPNQLDLFPDLGL